MIRPFCTLKSVRYLPLGIIKELVYGSKPRGVQELRGKIQGFVVPLPQQCHTYMLTRVEGEFSLFKENIFIF
jgi:hypothetical protein